MVSFRELSSQIILRSLELKSCGANSPGGEGFRAGNTCARGGSSTGDWVAGESTKWSDREEGLLFHATAERNVESIMKEGIREGWTSGVYASPDKSIALDAARTTTKAWAKENGITNFDDLPLAVIAIRVSSVKEEYPGDRITKITHKVLPDSFAKIEIHRLGDLDKLGRSNVSPKTFLPPTKAASPKTVYVIIPPSVLMKSLKKDKKLVKKDG